MGQGFRQVVMLVVGVSLFTTAIQSLGVIDSLMSAVENSQSAGVLNHIDFQWRDSIIWYFEWWWISHVLCCDRADSPILPKKPASMVS